MHIQTTIQQLGYSAAETKVYLAALSLGESTITELAKKAKLPRTSVQLVVEKLEQEGLLNLFLKRKHRFWVAENPEKLLIKLKEREAALKNVMPELQGMRYEAGARPMVKIYNGPEEIKQIMEDMLVTKHHIAAIVSWDDWREFFGAEYVDDFIRRRFEHFLKIRLITPRTSNAIRLKQTDDKELRLTRFLPAGAEIKNSNFIYANKVAIISLSKRQPVGILIEDIDVNNTLGILFESLWAQSLN